MNLELIQEIDEAIKGRRYRFEWVKGHIGHVLNEAADVRARGAAEAFQRGKPVPSGPGFGGPVAEPSIAQPVEALAPASLFDFDTHTLTVSLTDPEFARLEARARQLGVTVEDALRGLI
jgi:ribonuclease HI